MSDQLNEFKSDAQKAAEALVVDDPGKAKADLADMEHEREGNAVAEAGEEVVDEPVVAKDDAAPDDDAGEDAAEDKPVLTTRQQKLEALANKVEENRTESRKDFLEANPAKDADTAPDADATPAQVATAVEQQPDYEIRKNESGVDCAVLKIKGAEVLKPLKDVWAQAQKDVAADQKLEKASVTLKQIQRWNEDLGQREARLNSELEKLKTLAPQNSNPAPSDKDVPDKKEVYRQFVESVYTEDTEGAVKHLESLLSGRGDPTQLSPEKLQSTVSALVNEQQAISNQRAEQERVQADLHQQLTDEWTESVNKFTEEFPDIKKGSAAWQMTSKLCTEIQADPAFKDASYSQIFREAGKRVRSVAAEFAPSTQDRTARKMSSQSHIASRSATTAKPPVREAPAAPSQHDLIKQMRASRRPHQAY